MSTDTAEAQQTEALAKMISHGGDLEAQVQHLADVLHIWRTAPLAERRFLMVDHQAADEILQLLRLLTSPRRRA
jgi:hypothetical protein